MHKLIICDEKLVVMPLKILETPGYVPDLCWVELVVVHSKEVESITDHQLNYKDQDQGGNVRTDIRHFCLALIPDEDQHYRANHNNQERNTTFRPAWQSVDSQKAKDGSKYLS